jgi:hypothetical protein
LDANFNQLAPGLSWFAAIACSLFFDQAYVGIGVPDLPENTLGGVTLQGWGHTRSC